MWRHSCGQRSGALPCPALLPAQLPAQQGQVPATQPPRAKAPHKHRLLQHGSPMMRAHLKGEGEKN